MSQKSQKSTKKNIHIYTVYVLRNEKMSVEYKLEKLNGKNFTTWKVVMSSLLKSKRLWQYVNEDIKPEEEDQLVKNEEAKHLMYAAMDPAQIMATESCTTAYDLWRKLKENHKGSELSKEVKTIINTCAMSNPSGRVAELITQLKIQFHIDKWVPTKTRSPSTRMSKQQLNGR